MFSRTRSLLHYANITLRNADEENLVLFSHTAGRWLYNNDAQLKARYAPFNLDGLVQQATMMVASPVREFVKMADSNNRAFLLTHENGTQIVALIPTPISGPPVITTASEVATMDFLSRLGLPVPKVLAYSVIEVESEFILMEKAEGTSPDELSPNSLGTNFVGKLADILRPLGVDTNPFCVGPMTRTDFWDEERALIDNVYCGPWTSALQYQMDTVHREQRWIADFAKPHLNDSFLCVLPHQGNEFDHLMLLERYKILLPHLIPKESHFLNGHLWHPYLHSGRIFASHTAQNDQSKVDKITSLIDWHGAFIAPAFLQFTAPAVCSPSGVDHSSLALPVDFDSMDEVIRQVLLSHQKQAQICASFDRRAFGDFMLHPNSNHAYWGVPQLETRRSLERLSRRTWQTGPIPFRQHLIDIWTNFNSIAPGEPCPISLTPREVATQNKAYESLVDRLHHGRMLDSELGLERQGYVRNPGTETTVFDTEYFERVWCEAERMRCEYVDGATTEEDREVREILWPYRETLEDDPRTLLGNSTSLESSAGEEE